MININLLYVLSTVCLLSLIIAKILRNRIKKDYTICVDLLLTIGSLFIVLSFQENNFGFALVLFWGLFILSITDVFYRSLPNSINGVLLGLGLVLSMGSQFTNFLQAFAGSLAGYGILWFFAWGYKKITGEFGMGNGDIKLASALGAWVGVNDMPYLLFWASFLGSLFYCLMALFKQCTRTYKIPFGVFLSLSGMGLFTVRFSKGIFG